MFMLSVSSLEYRLTYVYVCCSVHDAELYVRTYVRMLSSAAAPPQHPHKVFLPRETAKFIDVLKYG